MVLASICAKNLSGEARGVRNYSSLNRVRDFEIPRFHRISRFREISKISRFQEILRISWDFACLQEVD